MEDRIESLNTKSDGDANTVTSTFHLIAREGEGKGRRKLEENRGGRNEREREDERKWKERGRGIWKKRRVK